MLTRFFSFTTIRNIFNISGLLITVPVLMFNRLIQLVGKFNNGIRFLLCVIDILYWKIKAVNFMIDQCNNLCKIIIQKRIQRIIKCIMKENLLLLTDSLKS